MVVAKEIPTRRSWRMNCLCTGKLNLLHFCTKSQVLFTLEGHGRPLIIANEDLGAVAEQGDKDDELWVINNITVPGVLYFDTYKSCQQCKSRVEQQTQCLGKSSKTDCMVMQKFNLFPQHTTAKSVKWSKL